MNISQSKFHETWILSDILWEKRQICLGNNAYYIALLKILTDSCHIKGSDTSCSENQLTFA